MRTPLMAGNWKMFKTAEEAVTFVRAFKKRVRGVEGREILLCPPFTALAATSRAVRGTPIRVGAQNMHPEDQGAFTGEISAEMIRTAGATHVLVGHSERRQLFGETNASCNRKLIQALRKGLIPIYCIGETLAEREEERTFAVLEAQLREGLAGIARKDAARVVIAYEPVWAIGTGRTATPQIAQEAHAHVRRVLTDLFGKTIAGRLRILYGGSVKPDNAGALMAEKDIDGVLVGGASLDPDAFARIVRA